MKGSVKLHYADSTRVHDLDMYFMHPLSS